MRWIIKDGKLFTAGLQSRMTKALVMARMRRSAEAPGSEPGPAAGNEGAGGPVAARQKAG